MALLHAERRCVRSRVLAGCPAPVRVSQNVVVSAPRRRGRLGLVSRVRMAGSPGAKLEEMTTRVSRASASAPIRNDPAGGDAVRRREDARGVHEWIEASPASSLRSLIAGYTGYLEEVDAPVRRLETPSGSAVLVLGFGPPLTVSEPAAADLKGQPPGSAVSSFAGGISDRSALVAHAGCQQGIQVRLGPLAVYALFGVRLEEINGQAGGVVDLADLGAGDWGEQLGAVNGWERRFALLDELLASRLAESETEPTPEVVYAWRRLRASHGTVRVGALVAESGLSHRAFIQRFRRQVGVAPKTAARIVRYERATMLLGQGTLSVAEVAAESGYADQAHLDREFAALAGRPPTRLLVQDVSGYERVGSILSKTG